MKLPEWATTVTPFSKILAFILFITLPIISFYFGLTLQQKVTINPIPTTFLPASPQPLPTSFPAKKTAENCQSSSECGLCSECQSGICNEIALCNPQEPPVCSTNKDCRNGTFCFEHFCKQQNYCRTDADCGIIGNNCEDKCAGAECNGAPRCSVVSKLNRGEPCLRGGYFPCQSPPSLKCINNVCNGF